MAKGINRHCFQMFAILMLKITVMLLFCFNQFLLVSRYDFISCLVDLMPLNSLARQERFNYQSAKSCAVMTHQVKENS